MTERHKSFTTAAPVQVPVTFDVDGVDTDQRPWKESFEAVPAVPGAALLDFIADADSDDGGRASQALVDFLEGAIVEDDKERFRDLIRDPKRLIEIETLAQICEWLVEQYATRPTEPSKPRSTGRAKSGRGSTATSSTTA